VAISLDRFTNLISTTLIGTIDNSSNPVTFTVTSATGFPSAGSFRVLIDNELFQVYSGAGTATWTANRPMEGTGIATHTGGPNVTHVMTAFEANSFRQEFNPIAYGGVGDGVANEVTPIQNAANDAHVLGGAVYIPQGVAGIWKLNSNITQYSNVVFLTNGAIFTGTGAASVAPLINMTLNGTVLGVMLSASGMSGSPAATRYAGGTTSGHPTTSTYAVGDWIVTQDGRMWICTTAGTPGTWQQPSPPLSFGVAGNIAALAASAAAGASGLVADASHVHPWSGLGVLSITNSWAALNTFTSGLTVSGGTLDTANPATHPSYVIATGLWSGTHYQAVIGWGNQARQIFTASTRDDTKAIEGDILVNA
jgi:hypothetical protein